MTACLRAIPMTFCEYTIFSSYVCARTAQEFLRNRLFFRKIFLTLHSTSRKMTWNEIKFDFGEMAEWSNAAVLKTVDLNGSGGSNPSLSAIRLENQALAKITNKFTNKSKFVRIVLYWTSLNCPIRKMVNDDRIQFSLFRIRRTMNDTSNPSKLTPPNHISAFCHQRRTLTSFSTTVSTVLVCCSSRWRSRSVR